MVFRSSAKTLDARATSPPVMTPRKVSRCVRSPLKVLKCPSQTPRPNHPLFYFLPSPSALRNGPYFPLDPNICPLGSMFHVPGKFLETLYVPGPTLIIKPDTLGCGNSLKSVLYQSGGLLEGSLSPWGVKPCQRRTAWWALVTTLSSAFRIMLGALKGLKTNTE